MNRDEASALMRQIWRVTLDMAAYKLDAVQRLGLTPKDLHAIATLADSGPMLASELAARLGVTNGAVTGIVNRLILAGVGVRDIDTQDQRRHIIRLKRSDLDAIFGDITHPALAQLETYSAEELRLLRKYYKDLDRLIHQELSESPES
jgi:DNA-binding MarR family transcriptional regulator